MWDEECLSVLAYGQQLPEDLMKFRVIKVGLWKGSEWV